MLKKILVVFALFLIPLFCNPAQAADVYIGTTSNGVEWYVREQTLDYGPIIRVIGVYNGKTQFNDYLLFRHQPKGVYSWVRSTYNGKSYKDNNWKIPDERCGSMYVFNYLWEHWYSKM